MEPGDGVGGRGSPFTTVRSGPRPPRGPVIWYWPDWGAVWPGRKSLVFLLILAISFQFQATPGARERPSEGGLVAEPGNTLL